MYQLTHIEQREDWDCVLASVAMLCSVTYEQVLEAHKAYHQSQGTDYRQSGNVFNLLKAITDKPLIWSEWYEYLPALVSVRQYNGAIETNWRQETCGHAMVLTLDEDGEIIILDPSSYYGDPSQVRGIGFKDPDKINGMGYVKRHIMDAVSLEGACERFFGDYPFPYITNNTIHGEWQKVENFMQSQL